MKSTIVGVDLAKRVIQVCVYTNKAVRSNKEMTPNEFTEFLAKSKPMTVVFEACGTSNYWLQKALDFKHDAKLISAQLVASVRQNQKTDKNDALAIVQSAMLPEVNFVVGKSVKQQELQSIVRFRELCIKQKTALSNQLDGLLAEFNISTAKRNGGLKGAVESTLEDAENGCSDLFRQALDTAGKLYVETIESLAIYDDCLEQSISHHPECKKLLKIEGVGTINAINLYIALGCAELGQFKKGKDASACIGLTPLQHSSGGKTKLGSIGKYVKNSMLRSLLIAGAMSCVIQVVKREARTTKEKWLQGLVERRGKQCAAVALANKTVRTAFAMLTQGTEYRAELISAS
ncbi:IS110 family transposase [Parashewanella spongiae]|uniref:IS110 family transposase n=1 Tax=Parashewanella spongiae TaxID=342950 RepID=A0A3A6TZT1_9GAMM|nr:IS110 family transposase [Parashewanella spongiae]MCL1079409.1 IS110 family transposase [Parashewanella spongiae]RJY14971.1 IS110 family transposase [Parashewanella spongiae]